MGESAGLLQGDTRSFNISGPSWAPGRRRPSLLSLRCEGLSSCLSLSPCSLPKALWHTCSPASPPKPALIAAEGSCHQPHPLPAGGDTAAATSQKTTGGPGAGAPGSRWGSDDGHPHAWGTREEQATYSCTQNDLSNSQPAHLGHMVPGPDVVNSLTGRTNEVCSLSPISEMRQSWQVQL